MTKKDALEIGESEAILEDTILQIGDIHRRMKRIEEEIRFIPEIKVMLGSIATAQEIMARSASSMAETFEKNERRITAMEIRHDALVKEALDTARKQDQVPIKTHQMILVSAVLPVFLISALAVFFTLYFTGQNLEAKIEKVGEVTVNNTARKIEAAKEELKEEHSDSKP